VIHVDQPTGTSAKAKPQIIAMADATHLSLPHSTSTAARCQHQRRTRQRHFQGAFQELGRQRGADKAGDTKLSSTSVRPSTSKPAMVINTGRI
jgi:hypothetical protein